MQYLTVDLVDHVVEASRGECLGQWSQAVNEDFDPIDDIQYYLDETDSSNPIMIFEATITPQWATFEENGLQENGSCILALKFNGDVISDFVDASDNTLVDSFAAYEMALHVPYGDTYSPELVWDSDCKLSLKLQYAIDDVIDAGGEATDNVLNGTSSLSGEIEFAKASFDHYDFAQKVDLLPTRSYVFDFPKSLTLFTDFKATGVYGQIWKTRVVEECTTTETTEGDIEVCEYVLYQEILIQNAIKGYDFNMTDYAFTVENVDGLDTICSLVTTEEADIEYPSPEEYSNYSTVTFACVIDNKDVDFLIQNANLNVKGDCPSTTDYCPQNATCGEDQLCKAVPLDIDYSYDASAVLQLLSADVDITGNFDIFKTNAYTPVYSTDNDVPFAPEEVVYFELWLDQTALTPYITINLTNLVICSDQRIVEQIVCSTTPDLAFRQTMIEAEAIQIYGDILQLQFYSEDQTVIRGSFKLPATWRLYLASLEALIDIEIAFEDGTSEARRLLLSSGSGSSNSDGGVASDYAETASGFTAAETTVQGSSSSAAKNLIFVANLMVAYMFINM